MSQFATKNVKDLKDFLCNTCFHDAKLENIKYNYLSDNLTVEAFNPIFDCKLKLDFSGIETVFATKGNWLYGNSEEISSLTVEDDFSYIQKYIPEFNKSVNEFLYLVFQMFSGDEIHIVCKRIYVNND